MRHQLLLLLSVGLVIFFALINVDAPSLTGAAIVKDYSRNQETYAVQLNDHILRFFGVEGVYFPSHPCTNIAKDFYSSIVLQPVQVTAGFGNKGPERITTTNFVIDWDDRYGTLDLSYGEHILADYEADSMISINTESIVRVPKSTRLNFFSMDLFGVTRDRFYINKGRFSTPSIDCVFILNNGDVICDCDAHSISGIEIAGITGVQKPTDYYAKLEEELKEMEMQNHKKI